MYKIKEIYTYIYICIYIRIQKIYNNSHQKEHKPLEPERTGEIPITLGTLNFQMGHN